MIQTCLPITAATVARAILLATAQDVKQHDIAIESVNLSTGDVTRLKTVYHLRRLQTTHP